MTYILVFAISFEPINRFTQYFVIQSSQFAMTSIGGIVVLLLLLLLLLFRLLPRVLTGTISSGPVQDTKNLKICPGR